VDSLLGIDNRIWRPECRDSEQVDRLRLPIKSTYQLFDAGIQANQLSGDQRQKAASSTEGIGMSPFLRNA
jgi:hypothetical protein